MKKVIGYIERPKEIDLLYKMVVGKSGRAWLYPVNSQNPADNIHCTNSDNWDIAGEGYAGRTLKFPLADNPDYAPFLLHGGWHSNSKSMLLDTGIDLTQKTLTRCVIALIVESSYPKYEMDEILHEENEWVLGSFERPDELAKKFANELGVKVFNYTQSIGGGSMGWVYPDTLSQDTTNDK